jgi:hypothetical protein
VPATQATQAVDAEEPVAVLYLPAAHAMHAVDAVDPVTVLYVPVEHTVHELCAVEAWYLPAAQVVHDDAPAAE